MHAAHESKSNCYHKLWVKTYYQENYGVSYFKIS
jgi:hypothetical protein